jgi:hemolysin activation/secretion protein
MKRIVASCLFLSLPAAAQAQSVPSSADVGRVQQELPQAEKRAPSVALPPQAAAAEDAPAGADQMMVTVAAYEVEGASDAFLPQLQALTQRYAAREMPLAEVWKLAREMTAFYRTQGYFLTKVTVPAQEMRDGGTLRLQVTEGWLEEVRFDHPQAADSRIRSLLERMKQRRPAHLPTIESVLLRLNDMPGISVRSVLEPGEADNAVRMTLIPVEEKAWSGQVELNNSGSRFMGPYQLRGGLQVTPAAFHETVLTGLGSVPADELKYGSVAHSVTLGDGWKAAAHVSLTASQPGSLLEPNDIEGEALGYGLELRYQAIRQRRENLGFGVALDGKDTRTDLLNTTLTRDHVRALRLNAEYDTDVWEGGYSWLSLTLSRGLDLFGSSEEGDLNLSRVAATPDFTTLHLSVLHRQFLGDDWMMLARAQGQYADEPLFSPEEIGYGGPVYGRAYDPSEITGDRGLMLAAEFRWLGAAQLHELAAAVKAQPYLFADAGKVWNLDPGARGGISGVSAGFGLRMQPLQRLSADLGVAWPLTLPAAMPLYGGEHDPRYLMSFKLQF